MTLLRVTPACGASLVALFFVLPSLSSAETTSSHLQNRKHTAIAAPASMPAIADPASPPAPATLEQKPPQPPKVAFQDGKLSISAANSTLGDILRSVHRQTGAIVDIPGNASERVVGDFGPGPAREVLAALLNGTNFNYVIVSSAANTDIPDHVMLLQKTAADAPKTAGVVPAPSFVPGAPQVQEEATDDAADDAAADQEAPETPPTPAAAADQSPPPQSGVRTPEQLLQELQRRQQGGQPGGAPGAFPQPPGQQQAPEQNSDQQ